MKAFQTVPSIAEYAEFSGRAYDRLIAAGGTDPGDAVQQSARKGETSAEKIHIKMAVQGRPFLRQPGIGGGEADVFPALWCSMGLPALERWPLEGWLAVACESSGRNCVGTVKFL